MKFKKIMKYILVIIIVIIGSLGAGTLMSINQEIPIEDFEIVIDNAKNGDFYLMLVNGNDSQILRVNSEGEIIDRNVSRSSSLFSKYVTEYEGCVLEESDGYIYCVKRWTDPNTMEIVKRDIVRLDIDDLSKKPEVLYSYENVESDLPQIKGIVENNGIVYVSLSGSKGTKAYVDKISYLGEEEGFETKRIMSLNSPDNDKFSGVSFNLQGNMVSLTRGGRVYLYDQNYNEKLIYPQSADSNEYASLMSMDRITGNFSIYNPNMQEIYYYDGELVNLIGKNQENNQKENKNQGREKFINEVFYNKEYFPLYIKYNSEYKANTVLITTKDPKDDKCKIAKLIGKDDFKVFDTIKFSNKVMVNEILLKSLKIFYISIGVLWGISFIIYIIKRGRKVVYKFILIIIPILSIGFIILCYFQIDYGKKVVYDLKVSNAITVNHSVMNNIDSGLVRKLRDNREAYWDGTYQTLYNMIQISSRMKFDDISEKILSKYKIAGTDDNYIYNSIFLIKDGKFYTGVSDNTGYMLPVGTQYFDGTENLFETLRTTGVPQNGEMMSRTVKGAVYITPIIDNNEMVGVLSTYYDIYTINQFVKNNIKEAFKICSRILIVALIPMVVMFRIVLKPLKELEEAVKQIAEGKYTVKLVDTGNDEFSRIRMVFNKMSEKLNSSVYRINNISKSYFRFVPRHVFKILEKNDILDIKLGDKRNINGVLVSHSLYNFDDIEQSIVEQGGDDLSSIISFVDRYFNIIFDNIENRQGTLLSSEINLDMMGYVFLNGERQAVECAIDIIKKLSTEKQLNQFGKIDTSLIIYKADILYGIVGKEKRSLPFIASVDRGEMNDILFNFKFSGAKVIITEDIKKSLEDWSELNIRYIGYSYTNNQNKQVQLYEVLDCCDLIERQQKESTISMFQKALDLFYNKEFYLARNEFSNVIRKSPLDNIARWYLFLSEKYINNKEIKDYNLALYGDKDVKIKDIDI